MEANMLVVLELVIVSRKTLSENTVSLVGYIFLYALTGLTDENLTKLIQHANIPPEHKVKIFNLQYLSVPVIQDVSFPSSTYSFKIR